MNDSVALVVNAGSSSLKTATANAQGILARHTVERIDGSIHGYEMALAESIGALGLGDTIPRVIGHRIVHGGTRFSTPTLITDRSITDMTALVELAPLHQPPGLAAITAAQQRFPGVPQIACFDTAFHTTMPTVNTRFAIPRTLHDAGIRRYGFHGLSYQFVSGELRRVRPDLADGRVVIAHLGSGASLCGLRGGQSVATTMGMTPLDGVPMSTRPGQIDPGVLLHLLRTGRPQPDGTTDPMTAKQLDDLLNHGCGLLGLSGISGDVRDLLASGERTAAEALEYFAAAVARSIAGLASDLGGLDTLVFTAGIGEHAAPVRSAIMDRLDWVGVISDAAANMRNDLVLSDASSRVTVLRVPTDEAAVIAAHALEFQDLPAVSTDATFPNPQENT